MLKFIYSIFWSEVETNSLCPNSFSPMPSGKFHNFAIEIMPHDDDEDVYILESLRNTAAKNKKINIDTSNETSNEIINETSNETSNEISNETSDVYDGKCDV